MTKEEKRLQKEQKRLQRLADAYLAIKEHGWEITNVGINGSVKILVPPITDERRLWTAMWDEDGLPHWLPEFTKGEK